MNNPHSLSIRIPGTLGFLDMLQQVSAHFGVVDLSHLEVSTKLIRNDATGQYDHYIIFSGKDERISNMPMSYNIDMVKTLAAGMHLGARVWVCDNDIQQPFEGAKDVKQIGVIKDEGYDDFHERCAARTQELLTEIRQGGGADISEILILDNEEEPRQCCKGDFETDSDTDPDAQYMRDACLNVQSNACLGNDIDKARQEDRSRRLSRSLNRPDEDFPVCGGRDDRNGWKDN